MNATAKMFRESCHHQSLNFNHKCTIRKRLQQSLSPTTMTASTSAPFRPMSDHRHRVHRHLIAIIAFSFTFLMTGAIGAEEDCPWAPANTAVKAGGSGGPSTSTPRIPNAIKTNCLCARNPSLNNQLSVQCFEIEVQQIVPLLLAHRTKEPLELLYLNASRVTDANGQVPARLFRDLKMVSLQLSGCDIKSIHPDAFRGQESQLKHLSLTQNLLTDVPKANFDRLRNLGLLDLSYNKITRVPQGVFEKLSKLATLKLNDNNLELGPNAFKGLENTLRNLNLKGTRLSSIPDAIANLSTLAFLDLAQNRLRELSPLPFVRLHSLTALNLERNLLQALPPTVFTGVNDTLSSLSLLNNLITHFPKEALHTLKELRVLDLGFNLLTEIPTDAFTGLNSLTLLALDGNPLTTLPATSFSQLNETLRGISLGGRFLVCDCQVKWIAEWVRDFDLQVTSREREPQFCGNPPELREQSFYQLKVDDFKCDKQNETILTSSTSKSTTTEYNLNLSQSDLALLGLDSNYFGKDGESEEETPDYAGEESQNESSAKVASSERAPFRNSHSPISSSTANSLEVTEEETDDLKPSTFRPSVRPSVLEIAPSSSTIRPRAVKPFRQLRPKLRPRPKVVTSTSTSTSLSSTSSSSSINADAKNQTRNATDYQPSLPSSNSHQRTHTIGHAVGVGNGNAGTGVIMKPKPTSSVASITPVQMPRNRPTQSVDTVLDIDESKIPVITGVGPSRITPTSNVGSVVPVRLPPSTTTTPAPRIIPTMPSPTSSPATYLHHHPQTHYSPARPPNLIFADKPDIVIRNLERHGDTVIVQWDGEKQTVYRVIYRLFGDETFKRSPPLAASERDYLLHNIPYNECVVICVVPYEEIVYNEISSSASSVPPGSQCKELRPNSPSALMNHMDKITIGASAAICATVLLAVLIFIGITKRAKNRRPPPSIIAKVPLGSFASNSPGPTTIVTSSSATQPPSLNHMKEWDQMSALSVRSIPRAQIYHGAMDGPSIGSGPSRPIIPHSHAHGYGHQHQHQRTIPDGHSTHRSYLSNHHAHHNHSYTKQNISTRNHAAAGSMSNYLNNQSRLLRASVGSLRSSQDGLNKLSGHTTQRQFEQNQRRRKRGSTKKLSSDSANTVSGYETPDNWTDHDMDVYVTRNHARRDHLVQM